MDETAQSANTGLRQRAVLVGRELERAALHEALDRAIGGEGRLVLLGGEAGIGKSTLAREVAREADRRGATLLIGHCHDLTAPPPYEPWLDLVLSLRDREGLPPLPEAFASGRLAGIDSPVALFTQTLDFLTSTAQRGPVLLLLEDLHWSDTPSLELLRLVAARVSTLPMLLLVTYRDDELTRRHPLYQQLPGLVRAGGGGMRIDLRRLDRTEITALVRASYALESADEARLTEYLERHAEGNPLFAVELMRALEEQGLLKATAQRDWLASIDRVVLPPLLTQVIDVRVNRLGEPARELLSIASVIGEEVPFGLWGKVAGVRDDELLTLVETATEARLLEFARDGTGVRFAHALTREALYTSAIPPRRRQWHRQVADALMAMPGPDPDAVAHHLVLAGDDRAATWLIQAGNRAQRVYAWIAAADRFVAAATALQLRPGDERERGWLLFRAARLMRLADPYRGLALLDDAQRLALAAGDRLLAGDTHYSIGILLTYTGHFDRGLAEMSAGIDFLETLDAADQLGDSMTAIALADSLPEHEASADKDLASSVELYIASGMHHRRGSVPWFLASAGRFVDACRIAEQFLSAAATIESPGGVVQSAVGHSYQGLGISHAATGRPLDATRAFESSRAIYRSLDHYGVIALCYLGELRFVALTYCADDPAYRQRLCEEAVAAFGHASGALAPGTPAGLVRLSTLVLEGEWDEATRLMDDMPPGGNAFVRREVREAASTIALNRGETATVAEIIDEFLPSGPRQQPGSRFYDDSLHYLRLASVLATQRNDLAEARRWLEAHDRWLAWSDATIEQAAGRLAWSRYHRAAGEIDAATASANDALSLATEPRLPLVLLEAHRELGELATSARPLDRAEQHLNEALRLARSCRARYQHATVLVALAELHAVQGQPEAAAALAGEAEAIGIALAAAPLLERCRDRSRGESVAKPVIPFGLTAREAEVLRLVAEGLTDAGVGERLFISPRTVSQHLHSIYGKLGVSTRTGAARIAIQFDIA